MQEIFVDTPDALNSLCEQLRDSEWLAMDTEFKKLMAPIGNSSLPVGRSDALVSTDKAVADRLSIQYVC